MKILCLGLGSIGQRHIRIAKELRKCEIYSLPSGYGQTNEKFVSDYDIKVCSSADEAIRIKPNFAIIANPTSLHMESALWLANQGIPFLIEKPVSDSNEYLGKLTDVVDSGSVKVLVAYNYRYHPAFNQICKWLDENRIGTILSLRAELGQWLPDWHPDRDYRQDYSAIKSLGGGVTLDLSHEIDLAYRLFGKVEKVSAICGHFSSLDIETEDIIEMTFVHSGRKISHIHLDYCQRVYSKWLTVVGEEGTITWDYMGNRVDLMKPNSRNLVFTVNENYCRDDMYKSQLLHWFDILENNAEPKVSLKDGIYVTNLALAAKKSSSEGRHLKFK